MAVGEHGTVIFIVVFCLLAPSIIALAAAPITGSPWLFQDTEYESYQSNELPIQFFDNNTAANLTWISYVDYDLPLNLVMPPPVFVPYVEFDGHYVSMYFKSSLAFTYYNWLSFGHYHSVFLGMPIYGSDWDFVPIHLVWTDIQARAAILNVTTPWFFLTCTGGDLNCTVLVGYDSFSFNSLQEAWDAGWLHLRIGLVTEQAAFRRSNFDYWATFWSVVTFDRNIFPFPLSEIFRIIFIAAILVLALYIVSKVKPF